MSAPVDSAPEGSTGAADLSSTPHLALEPLATSVSTSSDGLDAKPTSLNEKEKIEEEPTRPTIAFGDAGKDEQHVHVSSGAGFPRTGTKEFKRELTKDDKELANAGYSDLKEKKKNDENKHVDIVRLPTSIAHCCDFFCLPRD